MRLKSRQDYRKRRHARVRRKANGTAERPRMAVSISNRYMCVQFIDDVRRVTLASASTLGSDKGHGVAAAQVLGRSSAEAALAQGIACVVVDRGGYTFNGCVKAIIEGALEAGLSAGKKEA